MSMTHTTVEGPIASHERRVLDIGCGTNKVPGAIGMDVNPRTAADVIHDLDDLPYPFAENEFSEVIGRHVIETNFRMSFRHQEARLATCRPYTGIEVSAGN